MTAFTLSQKNGTCQAPFFCFFSALRVASPPDHPVFGLVEGGRGVCLAVALCCVGRLFAAPRSRLAFGAGRLRCCFCRRLSLDYTPPCQGSRRALRALDPSGSRPAVPIAAERLVHTMTRHTTIRRADVAGLLPRGAYTAGVPLTAEQCSVIISLLLAELVNRADGCGLLPVTNTAVTDDALHNIVRIMDRAITDISVLRDTPQRQKR